MFEPTTSAFEQPLDVNEIEELLATPEDGADAPGLERVEHALTTGYMRALELEAERLRLARRLGELAAVEEPVGDAHVRELASLSQRLAEAARELAQLRSLLEPLRRRASSARSKLTGPETNALVQTD